MRRIGFALFIVVGMLLTLAGCGGNNKFLGLNDRQAYLLTSPVTIDKVFLKDGTVSGSPVTLNAPQGLSSICFRSQTGELYGMGKDKEIYRVNAITGVCTVVSTSAIAITDFHGQLFSNWDGSRLYFIAVDGTSYEISPSSGNLIKAGASISYAVGDPNSGPVAGGVGYSATGKQLYFIDSANNVLAHMDAPLTGVLTTTGSLGVTIQGLSGMAVDPQLGTIYFTFDTGPSAGLYRVDGATGNTTQLGGSSVAGESMAIIP